MITAKDKKITKNNTGDNVIPFPINRNNRKAELIRKLQLIYCVSEQEILDLIRMI